MSETKFQGTPVKLSGNLPELGSSAPLFTITGLELEDISLQDYRGRNLVLNIFPSVDTGVCAQSVRTFNQKAAEVENTLVLCISKDLPFAMSRFCAAEGIENVFLASDFRSNFGQSYGLLQEDGPLAGLLARAVVVLDAKGTVAYTQLVPEITEEPDYEAALKAVSDSGGA